eukprot:COSAG05_NODE_8212_length_726_cov_1.035088_2_plen_30_part_01
MSNEREALDPGLRENLFVKIPQLAPINYYI